MQTSNTQVSSNFKLSEFEYSAIAASKKIENRVTDPIVLESIRNLVSKVLQPLRGKVNKPVYISSGYRSSELNKAVGGAASSQHMKGEASDIKITGMSSYDIANLVVKMGLPYDQLILYPSFVHVSTKRVGTNRNQLLYNSSYNGKRL
ncbi:D-Ala-D-Ala carboxypeptidase family metallohydrolase [Dysgonomonas sp. 520]|uniref:D-Ala-D-Ala carboxypeptidase family metallohydrolase n=1 Tax=Dysgonomonas sp. 520 TaxID=2302931 RepID=UPI0013D35B95|nr:D-Ala-D-Ala carboxypeptidase family metallohydrolase [Dysgonomonas sp. 520]NDW09068.1 DUF882 domain-containing protein [Dysgonomonas sp. 520]